MDVDVEWPRLVQRCYSTEGTMPYGDRVLAEAFFVSPFLNHTITKQCRPEGSLESSRLIFHSLLDQLDHVVHGFDQ